MENPYRAPGPAGAISPPVGFGFVSGMFVLVLLGEVALFSLDCTVEALLFRVFSFDEEWVGMLTVAVLLARCCWLKWRDRASSKGAEPGAEEAKEPDEQPTPGGTGELSPEKLRGELWAWIGLVALAGWIVMDKLGDGYLAVLRGVALSMARDGALFAAVAAASSVSLLGVWFLLRGMGGLPLPRPR